MSQWPRCSLDGGEKRGAGRLQGICGLQPGCRSLLQLLQRCHQQAAVRCWRVQSAGLLLGDGYYRLPSHPPQHYCIRIKLSVGRSVLDICGFRLPAVICYCVFRVGSSWVTASAVTSSRQGWVHDDYQEGRNPWHAINET
jgi:hypothetical protein